MMNRRNFVRRAGVAGISLLGLSIAARRAVADPEPAPGSMPVSPSGSLPDVDVFPFAFGGEEAFVIHDGAITLPSIQPMFVPEAPKPQMDALLKSSFLPVDRLSLSVNVLVLKSKSDVVLFDAGAGSAFGPAAGKLVRGLARVGIAPADVKTIYITHAHQDHISGLLDSETKLVFPNAKIVIAKTEADFWNSEHPDLTGMKVSAETRAQALTGIQKILAGARANLELTGAEKLSSNIELVPAPGHTPGHSMFRLSRGQDTLLVMGDAVHVFALQFPHPEWTMAYDTDPALAIKTRRKLFADAAAAQTMLLGAHMPFPGIGHVREAKQGYEWMPRPWVV